jgi:hypothetical protein
MAYHGMGWFRPAKSPRMPRRAREPVRQVGPVCVVY